MSKTLIALIVTVVVSIGGEVAHAQLLFPQARSDYRQPTTYSPEDPNFRSRLFLEQTGHSGRFYNCDGEEDKRFSPYICWSTVDNTEYVRTWRNVLRCDIREVKGRVLTGNCCGNANCGCASCQQRYESMVQKGRSGETKPASEWAKPAHMAKQNASETMKR